MYVLLFGSIELKKTYEFRDTLSVLVTMGTW